MKARHIPAFALLLAVLLAPNLANAHEEYGNAPGPLAAIESAVETGRISEAEGLLYKVYAVQGSELLPAEYIPAETIPAKCGAQIFLEAKKNLEQMPEAIRQQTAMAMVRPNLPEYIDTTHFRIHYSTSGGSIIYGWPNTAYRDAVMDACEASWSFYHVTQNWPPPPSDGGSGGGSGLIDCYVTSLSGVYGYAEAESPAGQHVNDYTGFFVIDNDYAGFGYVDRTEPMKVTVAHELHHVVQFGLNAFGASWWMENTSTFMEDEVYDAIDDNYNYLNCYFGVPWERLQNFNGCYEYACFVWPTYIKENWSHSVVRNVWVDYADLTNIYTCFDNNFAPYGKNLDTAMAEWTRWNIFTGTRDDGNHYIEGGPYNRYVNIDNDVTIYPQYDLHPTGYKEPKGLGTNYTRFRPNPGSTDDRIDITYRGPDCSYDHVIHFARKFAGEETYEEYEVVVDGAGNATIELGNWDDTEWLFMSAPMKRACGALTRDFSFDVETSQDPTGLDDLARPTRVIRLDQNNPNPFRPKTSIGYALRVDAPVRIDIFDATGRHVRRLVDGVQPAGEYKIAWFGADDQGHAVPNGLYFYSMEANGQKQVRKMLIVD